jgi:hypothetical protein
MIVSCFSSIESDFCTIVSISLLLSGITNSFTTSITASVSKLARCPHIVLGFFSNVSVLTAHTSLASCLVSMLLLITPQLQPFQSFLLG